MDWRQECLVVLPCFNEEHGLSVLLPRLVKLLPHVLVVDDGSTDRTRQIAHEQGAAVLPLPSNQGKGTALRHGLEQARLRGFTWVLVMDGDGQHSPEDIQDFLNLAEKDSPDLIIGNRMVHCDNMPWVRHWTNRYLSYRISSLVGQTLPDTQCGFRLIRLSALEGLNLSTTGFEIESEILTQMAMVGCRIAFVPIATIYKEEQSKIHPVRDSLRWFRWLYSVKPVTPPPPPPAEALKPSQA
jgi:glycosyltransferase involved in cell wall biosynthesis